MILKLIDKKNIGGNIKSFVFQPEKKLKWKAGQYLIYSLPHKPQDLRGDMRFFTISSSPFEQNPVITTRIEKIPSSFKKNLDGLKIGQILEAKGPDGDFIVKNAKNQYVFLAGGIGITPFMSIIRQLNFEKKPINVTLIYENRTRNITFRRELEEISANHSELRIRNVTNPARIDKKYLTNIIRDFKKYFFYVSGPDQMVEALVKLLKTLKTPAENIKEDYFSGYEGI